MPSSRAPFFMRAILLVVLQAALTEGAATGNHSTMSITGSGGFHHKAHAGPMQPGDIEGVSDRALLMRRVSGCNSDECSGCSSTECGNTQGCEMKGSSCAAKVPGESLAQYNVLVNSSSLVAQSSQDLFSLEGTCQTNSDCSVDSSTSTRCNAMNGTVNGGCRQKCQWGASDKKCHQECPFYGTHKNNCNSKSHCQFNKQSNLCECKEASTSHSGASKAHGPCKKHSR